jgi:hypothetical protein
MNFGKTSQSSNVNVQTADRNTISTQRTDCDISDVVTEQIVEQIVEQTPDFVQPEAWVEIVAGASVGKVFPITPNVAYTFGRSSKKSQYVIEGHPEVSGLHFQLMYMPQKKGFYLIDESINGLYYNGFRLEKGKKYKVLPGDQVGIGSMQCVITVGVR